MDFVSGKKRFGLVLVVIVILLSSGVSLAADKSVEHFKMLSSIEYSGQGQYTNQIETMFTVEKKTSKSGAIANYLITTKDFDLNSKDKSSKGMSFTIDKSTSKIVKADKDLWLHQKVNNQCAATLEKVTKDNIGKTWKQTFNLLLPGKSYPKKLSFTVSAIKVKTDIYGEMIAVRAMSAPFKTAAKKKDGKKGEIKSRINSAFLFDSEIEDIYLSMSVLEAVTNLSGSKETLRNEVATYKTDASGQAFDLSGLDKKFENFVKKVGFAKKSLEIVEETQLPMWAQSYATNSAQVANISAAIACEGATNPVVTVSLPSSQTFAMQSFGSTGPLGATASTGASISSSLGAGVPAMAGMNIVAAPAIMGLAPGTAALAGGGTAVGVAAAGGGGGGGGGTASP